MDEDSWQYLAPAASEHSDACRVRLFQWRLRNAGLPAVNDVERFPCACAQPLGGHPPGRWRLEPAQHPAWCVVEGEHPWTECTLTKMVPKEETGEDVPAQ